MENIGMNAKIINTPKRQSPSSRKKENTLTLAEQIKLNYLIVMKVVLEVKKKKRR